MPESARYYNTFDAETCARDVGMVSKDTRCTSVRIRVSGMLPGVGISFRLGTMGREWRQEPGIQIACVFSGAESASATRNSSYVKCRPRANAAARLNSSRDTNFRPIVGEAESLLEYFR